MWKIGNIEINGRVVLAPMAGITSLAYREFMKPFGISLSYTEMISDAGLTYNNARTFEYLTTSSIDRPVGLQLFGGNSEKSVQAIKILQKANISYDILDINLGCPVQKVTKAGAGSSWLKNPQKLYEHMRMICEISDKPVTAKIRLGWDEKNINVFDVVEALEKAGVKAISIHARTAKQMYSGLPDYEKIRNLRSKMHVPLIVSGNIYSLEDAINAINITGADAVMVARGGIGNPNLIKQINTYYEDGTILPDIPVDTNLEYLDRYAKMLISEKGEERAMLVLRGIAPKFLNGYPKLKEYKIRMASCLNTYADLKTIMDEIIRK